jgi:hypothetical protein
MKKRILFAGIAGIMLVFGFVLTGCDNGTGGGGDAIGSVYQGTYTGTNGSTGTLTVGADSTGGAHALTGIRTGGGSGGTYSGIKFTWAYVYKDDIKIGLVLAVGGESTIGLGEDAGTIAFALLFMGGAQPVTDDIDETYSFYGKTNPGSED